MNLLPGAVIDRPGNSEENQTGGWRTQRPVIDPEKCKACGMCWVYCPDAALIPGSPYRIDYRYCKGCGVCANECPFGAIRMEDEIK
jgi:pyruvate ferredoxin oxidoreductase delta subunit